MRWKRAVLCAASLNACTSPSEPAPPPAQLSAPFSITPLGVRGDPGDRLGSGLARVGDLDGDGFGDIAVGIPGAANGSGRVLLVAGSPAGLSAIATSTLLSVEGAGAAFGASLAFLGDVDGDGVGDLAVGAPRHSNSEPEEGRVYVFRDSPNGFDMELFWTMETNTPGQRFGSRVAAAGDFDGDGRSDLWVVTAPASGPAAIYLYRGSGPSLETTPTWTTPGLTVAGAGDVDGDNRDDVVIGDPTADNNSGRCDLWLGTSNGLPAEQPSRTWRGGPGERLGASVAMVGDLDGDGLADFVCGASGANGGAGKLVVIFGDATKSPMDLGGNLFAVRELGTAVAPAGDVNADGLADLLIGADGNGDGEVLVLAGSSGNALSTVLWRGRCAECLPGHGYGSVVAPLGDLNGDGFADIGTGAPTLSVPTGVAIGALEVGLGAATEPLGLAWKTWTFPRWNNGRNESLAIVMQGDATGDGRHDLVIGEPGREHPSMPDSQRAGVAQIWRYDEESNAFRIHRGYAGEINSLAGAAVALLDPKNGGASTMLLGMPSFTSASASIGAATIYGGPFFGIGDHDGAAFGASLAAVGDVDGDGLHDWVVGGPGERASPTSNRVGTAVVYGGRVFQNSAGAFVPAPPSELWRGLGITPNAELGAVVSAAGDVDGDTFSDVLIAAPGERKVYLIRGGVGPLSPLPLDVSTQIDHRGVALAALGDINGDQLGDFAIGLPEADGARGQVLVFLGHRSAFTAPLVLAGFAPGDRFGASIASAGDLDADGFADLIIGAPGFDGTFTDGGRAEIYRGSSGGLEGSPYWTIDGDRDGASLGDLVAGGGDVDGDGFPDFAVVARDLVPTPGSTEAARLFLYRGNGAITTARQPRPNLLRVAGEQVISPFGVSNYPNAVSLRLYVASPFGHGLLHLETEVTDEPSWSNPIRQQSAPSLYSGEVLALRQTITGLSKATVYRWRTRVHYDLVRAPPQDTSRWYLGGLPGQPTQVHFRTRDNVSPVAAPDTYTCVSDVGLDVVAVPPNAASPGLLANDSDGDFDTLVVSLPDGSLSGPTAHGTVVLSREGGFRYRSEPGFVGVDRFRYRVSDEVGGETSAEVTIVVVPAGCDPSVVGVCGRGDVRGTLETTGGPRGFACRVQVTAGVRSLVCDQRDGVLTLSEPVCE